MEDLIERAGVRFTDNPRQLGKSQIRLVGLAPHKPEPSSGEAEFTSSSGGVRALSNANEGLGGKEQ